MCISRGLISFLMKKNCWICLIYFFLSFVSKAQIPNNSFELWSNDSGYQNPNGWDNLNKVTQSYSVFTCSRLSTGSAASNYVTVRTVSISGKGLIPGRIVSGKIDSVTFKPISGFPYNLRPKYLSFSLQYMVALPSDTAFVSVLLTKWNTNSLLRDTVAYGISRFNAMAHQWFTAQTQLNYKVEGNPDSACIVISSSGVSALENSYMYVDDLNFGNTVDSIGSEKFNGLGIPYPNPFRDEINVNWDINVAGPLMVRIYNALGDLIYSETAKQSPFKVDSYDWPQGLYVIEMRSQNRLLIEKIVK